jgi:hypothetical protein
MLSGEKQLTFPFESSASAGSSDSSKSIVTLGSLTLPGDVERHGRIGNQLRKRALLKKRRARSQTGRLVIRKFYAAQLWDRQCMMCDGIFHPAQLQVHHHPPRRVTGEPAVAKHISRQMMGALREALARTDTFVLCANCHALVEAWPGMTRRGWVDKAEFLGWLRRARASRRARYEEILRQMLGAPLDGLDLSQLLERLLADTPLQLPAALTTSLPE